MSLMDTHRKTQAIFILICFKGRKSVRYVALFFCICFQHCKSPVNLINLLRLLVTFFSILTSVS